MEQQQQQRVKAERIATMDLNHNQYDMDILIKNINNLDLKTILYTQKLTVEFCVDYLLNDDYMTCVEDTYYFMADTILRHQPHLTMNDIIEYIKSKE